MINVCKIFENNITYVEYARSGVEYYTENLEEARYLTDIGWKCNKTSIGFRLVPPEISVADLTEYKRAIQYENLSFNYIYFKFMKKLLKQNILSSYIKEIIEANRLKYKRFRFLISTGPVLDTEIRIVGSDSRIEKLKMDMVSKFIESKEYVECQKAYGEKQFAYKELETNIIPLAEQPKILQEFYLSLKNKMEFVSSKPVYNEKIFKIYNIEKIQSDIDIIIFLPFGCFKYMSSFITVENVRKVMFWEFHADNTKESTFKLMNKELKGKNVLIIDNMYSGKTMKKIKEKVKELGGKPILLGLNPKNATNLQLVDYFMILNTIYKKDELNISDENLFENVYLRTLTGGNDEKS